MFLDASTWQALAIAGAVGGVAGLIAGFVANATNLIGAILIGIIWLSTATLQAPLHGVLERGHDPAAEARLVRTSWIRTLAWTELRRGMYLRDGCEIYLKEAKVEGAQAHVGPRHICFRAGSRAASSTTINASAANQPCSASAMRAGGARAFP